MVGNVIIIASSWHISGDRKVLLGCTMSGYTSLADQVCCSLSRSTSSPPSPRWSTRSSSLLHAGLSQETERSCLAVPCQGTRAWQTKYVAHLPQVDLQVRHHHHEAGEHLHGQVNSSTASHEHFVKTFSF